MSAVNGRKVPISRAAQTIRLVASVLVDPLPVLLLHADTQTHSVGLYSAHPIPLTPIAGRVAATSVARHESLRLRRVLYDAKELMWAHCHSRHTDRSIVPMLRFVGVRPGSRTRVRNPGCANAPDVASTARREVESVIERRVQIAMSRATIAPTKRAGRRMHPARS